MQRDPQGAAEAGRNRMEALRHLDALGRAGTRSKLIIPGEPAPDDDNGRWRFRPITAAEFDRRVYAQDWLVHGVLFPRQPGVICGPQKSLKTNALADLALSLATATPFLNQFAVPRKTRVAVISGETGEEALQETFRRVARAKGIAFGDLEDLLLEFSLPQFGRVDDVLELERGVKEHGAEVLILDPLYLTLLSGADRPVDEKSIFQMGSHLRAIARVIERAGASVILVHHANRRGEKFQPMELEHISYAGIAEFARQWIFLNRKEPYQHDGRHSLWLSVGGSGGQSGLWELRVDEGLRSDPGGRRWEVELLAGDARRTEKAEAAERRETEQTERQRAKLRKEDAKVLDAIDKVTGRTKQAAATRNELRTEAGINQDTLRDILGRLIEEGRAVECVFDKKTGATVREVVGYKRPVPGVSARDADDADDADGPPVRGPSVRPHRTARGRGPDGGKKSGSKSQEKPKPPEAA